LTDYLVIKIGGRPAAQSDVLEALLRNMHDLGQSAYRCILVHGGGDDVSSLSRRLGIEPIFINGKRMTSRAEMDLVDMGLAGLVNTRILRQATRLGIRALGLSGVSAGLFTALSADGNPENRTGTVHTVRPEILIDLCSLGYLPIVSSISIDESDAQGLNINADDAAMAIAKALQAAALLYISDIPGVMNAQQVLPILDRDSIERYIKEAVITGGMIPKVQGALSALDAGLGRIIIGSFQAIGDLERLLAGDQGTSIVSQQE
jgi:acetylglutamate kinase